jgi:hypothetical protein
MLPVTVTTDTLEALQQAYPRAQLAGNRQLLAKETSTLLAGHTLSREVAITRLRDALHKTGLGTNKEEGRRG